MLCVQTVQQRGAAVIKARKLSSAMSAAKAICDHMRDIWSGTSQVDAPFPLVSTTMLFLKEHANSVLVQAWFIMLFNL